MVMLIGNDAVEDARDGVASAIVTIDSMHGWYVE